MKIGFFIEWMVNSLDPSNKWNVVGEELLSLGWCKELMKLDTNIQADVYSYNKLPTEKKENFFKHYKTLKEEYKVIREENTILKEGLNTARGASE